VRRAQRAARPEPLSTCAARHLGRIRLAVERGDIEALGQAVTDVRDELESNLRLRLDAKPGHREPVSELRVVGAPDPTFHQARELLLRRDPRALDEFADLHYRRSTNTIAKEWYAYALTLFGQATDIHDIIELLEAAIASDRFHEHRGWTARWNLACALRRLPSRADEALDVLLPVLDLVHPPGFRLCLLWAIEQGRSDALGRFCLRARHYEAHMLAALLDAEPSAAPVAGRGSGITSAGSTGSCGTRTGSSPTRGSAALRGAGSADARVHRDLARRDRRRVVPAARRGRPRNRRLQELGLRRGAERGSRRSAASWRCQLHWRVPSTAATSIRGRRRSSCNPPRWAQRHGFREDGLRVLRQTWRETSFSEADASLWAERFGGAVGDVGSGPTPAERSGVGGSEPVDAAMPRRDAPDSGPPGAAEVTGRRAALALMLDWENVKVSLARHLEDLPEPHAQAGRARLDGVELATRLLDAASRHGLPRQRWAVADWDRDFFEGDQKAVRNARFSTDIAGRDKANASDHLLREKIHFVLREHPEIPVYVIGTGDGDFHEVVKTLQAQGKQVILWTTRRAVSESYGGSLRGPDRIRIEWLEDLVFGDAPGTGAR
jgi:hypothetical protein